VLLLIDRTALCARRAQPVRTLRRAPECIPRPIVQIAVGIIAQAADALQRIEDGIAVHRLALGQLGRPLRLAIRIDEAQAQQVGARPADGFVTAGVVDDIDQPGDGDEPLLTDDELRLRIEQLDQVRHRFTVVRLADPVGHFIDRHVDRLLKLRQRAERSGGQGSEDVVVGAVVFVGHRRRSGERRRCGETERQRDGAMQRRRGPVDCQNAATGGRAAGGRETDGSS